jgi:dolichyl-phosphate beta-glucosyltransferase
LDIKPKIAIVVPCYNEAQRLKGDEFLNYLESNEDVCFIFVDDGSTDGTYDLLSRLQSLRPEQILCLRHRKNQGKAEAVRTGFAKAMNINARYMGYWDADLATPLRFINEFYEILGNSELKIVIGSRVSLLGHAIKRKALRHYFGRVFATFASIALGVAIYDTQCGSKLFQNTNDLRKVFSRPFSGKWTFDVEILARFILVERNKKETNIGKIAVEFPIDEWTHISGSTVAPSDFFLGIIHLFKIYLILHFPGASRTYFDLFYSQ